MEFYKGAWSNVKAADWGSLVRGWPAADKDKLRELLQAADAALAETSEGSMAEMPKQPTRPWVQERRARGAACGRRKEKARPGKPAAVRSRLSPAPGKELPC
jgi:hypothetical protein